MLGRLLLTAVLVIPTSPALAVDVSREIVVNAPASEVWESVGAFCSIGTWYPGIDSCTEETMDGAVHRKLVTADGAEFLEKHMDAGSDMAYGYAIIEGPLPVKDYEAVFEVKDNGDSSTIVWSSSFASDGASDEEAAEVVAGIYEAGLDAIKARIED